MKKNKVHKWNKNTVIIDISHMQSRSVETSCIFNNESCIHYSACDEMGDCTFPHMVSVARSGNFWEVGIGIGKRLGIGNVNRERIGKRDWEWEWGFEKRDWESEYELLIISGIGTEKDIRNGNWKEGLGMGTQTDKEIKNGNGN